MGLAVGDSVGIEVGLKVDGDDVGVSVGLVEGELVGEEEGLLLGPDVGLRVGECVGLEVGEYVIKLLPVSIGVPAKDILVSGEPGTPHINTPLFW